MTATWTMMDVVQKLMILFSVRGACLSYRRAFYVDHENISDLLSTLRSTHISPSR